MDIFVGLIGFALISFAVVAVAGAIIKKKKEKLRKSGSCHSESAQLIGFLHPNSLSGGGGERVLWCAVLAAQSVFPDAQILVYSAWSDAHVKLEDAVTETKTKVREQFGLDLADVSFLPVDITCAHLVDSTRYPRLTLLLQAFGAARLGVHAFWRQPVDVFVDTANLTFSLFFPKLCGAQTVSYVHYPTISTDMLTIVRTRKAQFNNSSGIANSARLSFLKLLYYRAFAYLYAVAALCCDIPLANSTWTRNHLEALWWKTNEITTVFPPCPTFGNDAATESERDDSLILSVGQFRPEKNHALQLDVMAHLKNHSTLDAKLLMIGGTRNAKDATRAQQLRTDAKQRGLPVTVVANASRDELAHALRTASVGLHTMRDEHFGISVVELQAHGMLAVAHRSGGVALDIVEDGVTGLLAGDSAVEYAEKIIAAMHGMGDADRQRMRAEAVKASARFSEESFRERFGEVLATKVAKR